jgi:hypothetical protein
MTEQRPPRASDQLVGEPAPADPSDPRKRKTKEHPRAKRKEATSLAWALRIAIVAVIISLSAVLLRMQMEDGQRASRLATQAALAASRQAAPLLLPAEARPQGTLSATAKRVELLQLGWDVYTVANNRALEIEVAANPAAIIPILALYQDGRLVAQASSAGTEGNVQRLAFTTAAQGNYTVLVGSIGGAAGRYEIRDNSR